MTVTELRKALKGIPGKYEVILSSDPEGNRFSPVFQLSAEHFDKHGNDVGADEAGDINSLVFWPND